jgi:hypothetical protein
MPKLATPSQRLVQRNHPSWEDDPAAQAALGPVIAKWLAQGVLEYVQWDDTQPVLLQPCGAVPKGSVPFYRSITDARFGNTMYRDSDWGVTYSRVLRDIYPQLSFKPALFCMRHCQSPAIIAQTVDLGAGPLQWLLLQSQCQCSVAASHWATLTRMPFSSEQERPRIMCEPYASELTRPLLCAPTSVYAAVTAASRYSLCLLKAASCRTSLKQTRTP